MSEAEQEIVTPGSSSQEASPQDSSSQDTSQGKNDTEGDSPYTEEQRKAITEIKAGAMKAELKHLDKKKSDTGKTYYVETLDETPPEQIDWWQKYAMIITRHMSKDGKQVERVSLRINSDHIKTSMEGCIKSYPGVSFSTKKVSIDAPYHVLFHYRAELVKAAEKLEDGSEATRHFQLLLNFIKEEFGEELSQSKNLLEQGLMSYDLLWTIFRPGSIVYSSMYGQQRAFRVSSYQYRGGQEPGLLLDTSYVDFDGDDFGTRSTRLVIPAFRGSAPINALETVPQELHNQSKELKAVLLARGKSFYRLADMSFQNYSGAAMDLEDSCKPKRVKADGRVVIDCATHCRFNPDMSFYTRLFGNTTDEGQRNERRFDGELTDVKKFRPTLTDDQLLLASGLVRGFSFAEKKWLDFFVEQLSPIEWNEKCFDQLVLANSHKNIVRALVSDHVQASNTFDDIVEGKGKGLVMVLHGPPGVGKTLTAECVAEYTKRPLYIVSSGDLGTDSGTLDERLSEILDMASTWKVVLLIDEADVFLEARSQNDLERNALVSIFLRVLEYYQGIMFLTTNRVDTFDDAFKSRIHVPLKYSNLNALSREKIWRNFLDNVDGGVEIDAAGYTALSQADLNGRQIKNVIRTARSLAHYDHKKLDVEMLQQVISIQLEFENEMAAMGTGSSVSTAVKG